MKKLNLYIALTLIFITSFSLTFFDLISFSNESSPSVETHIIKKLSKPSQNSHKSKELVFIYIGCSTCPAANLEYLPELIKNIRKDLRKKAEEKGYGMISIGISKEANIRNGLIHLSKFGPFDEISIGNSWANIALKRYIFNHIAGIAATPQIVVTIRKYESINKNGYSHRIYGTEIEKVIVNKVGSDKILAWWKSNLSL